MRDYTRLRTELVEEHSRHKQRLEKLLEDALIKLSSVAADLLGVSARAMIEALIAGERDPKVLADLARGKLNAKRAALLEALNGRFDDHHAELGLNMAQFPTSAHLVSWAKLSPQTIQSGPKVKAGHTGKANRYLNGVLGEVATAAAKTDTFLGERYRRLVRRRGKQRALVAVARSILVIVWHLLNDPGARYIDLGSDYYTNRLDPDRKTRDLLRQLQVLGHNVTIAPAA